MMGVALIKECLKHNTRVAAVVRQSSKNLYRIPKSDLVNIVECDNAELDSLPGIIENGYDVFYHFAWDGTSRALRNDVVIHEENLRHTLTAVRAAKELGVCRIYRGGVPGRVWTCE